MCMTANLLDSAAAQNALRITIEGINGSEGKSVMQGLLVGFLESLGHKVFVGDYAHNERVVPQAPNFDGIYLTRHEFKPMRVEILIPSPLSHNEPVLIQLRTHEEWRELRHKVHLPDSGPSRQCPTQSSAPAV
jgi:hypothetical protein